MVSILIFLLVIPLSKLNARELNYDTAIIAIRSDTGLAKDTLTVRIADNMFKRYLGLRQADSLDTGTGMLFVYTNERTRTFTMEGMKIPLDIVFINSNRAIGSIHSVSPGRESIRSPHKSMWVLETRYGWANRNNIRTGDMFSFEEKSGKP